MDEYLIWVIPEDGRMRVGASRADRSPLPFGADVIARVPGCDVSMMLCWARRCAKLTKRGWGVERMIEACEAERT